MRLLWAYGVRGDEPYKEKGCEHMSSVCGGEMVRRHLRIRQQIKEMSTFGDLCLVELAFGKEGKAYND